MDSRVLFAVSRVSKDVFGEVKKDYSEGISLYNRPELADIRLVAGARAALTRIRERDEDMALFLQHIDAKLNTLLKKVDNTPALMDKLTSQSVNIAGNGLAFWSKESYAKGDLLEIYIVLPLSETFIDCFGEVVDCLEEKADGGIRHRVSCRFKIIMDNDREELIQYNFKQQSLALKRRRKECRC